MECAVISSMLSMLKLCMDCLGLKNKGKMGEREQKVAVVK